MTRQQTPIDRLILSAIQKVAASTRGYFLEAEIRAEILNDPDVGHVLADVRARHSGWGIDQLLIRYIDRRIGELLQARDANGIRIYECYAAGSRERRWQPFRMMTADTLRAVMRKTRTQERDLHIKGEATL